MNRFGDTVCMFVHASDGLEYYRYCTMIWIKSKGLSFLTYYSSTIQETQDSQLTYRSLFRPASPPTPTSYLVLYLVAKKHKVRSTVLVLPVVRSTSLTNAVCTGRQPTVLEAYVEPLYSNFLFFGALSGLKMHRSFSRGKCGTRIYTDRE